MDFAKLRKLSPGTKIQVGDRTYQLVEILPEREVQELYLYDEEELEFMLQVPDDDDPSKVQFYKVFRHGEQKQYQIQGFKRHVRVLDSEPA